MADKVMKMSIMGNSRRQREQDNYFANRQRPAQPQRRPKSEPPAEAPYQDGFGTWQVMIPKSVPEAERSTQAAVMIASVLSEPREVMVRSLGNWTSYEHFEEVTRD